MVVNELRSCDCLRPGSVHCVAGLPLLSIRKARGRWEPLLFPDSKPRRSGFNSFRSTSPGLTTLPHRAESSGGVSNGG